MPCVFHKLKQIIMNCSQIYMGVNLSLPQVESDVFSVEQISPSDDEYSNLMAALNTNYIYYLAPHTGCGCGWDVTNTGTEFDALSKKSLFALKVYLRNLSPEQSIYVLFCNQNSIGFTPASADEVDILDFLSILDAGHLKFGEPYSRLYLLKASQSDK